jgi:hypothetical protein
MTYLYYYTPIFEGPLPEDAETTVKQPGADVGSGPEFGVLPPGCNLLKYDDAQSRAVVRLVASSAPLQGWVPKTSAEVLVDYPGLWGVS